MASTPSATCPKDCLHWGAPRADAAAVNASGSRHKTIIRISNLGADEFGHVPDRCHLGLNAAALGGQGGALSFEGGQLAWALRSASMADRAVLVLPRLAASSIAVST
jgi:hypothetical protein